jgi:hypothetical protein
MLSIDTDLAFAVTVISKYLSFFSGQQALLGQIWSDITFGVWVVWIGSWVRL